MTGEDTFDHTFYDELLGCLYTLDPKLIESVNAQWSGFKEYAENGGNPGVDEWISCELQGVSHIYLFLFCPDQKFFKNL